MSCPEQKRIVCYCGRTFLAEEMDWIRDLIASHPDYNRNNLSRMVCENLSWFRPDGRLKDMSCRVAMLRMHRDGLITLPPPQKRNANGRTRPKPTSLSDPRQPICMPAGKLGKLLFRPVQDRNNSTLWNECIERYHYLGYHPLPGAQIRYLLFAGEHLLAALGFGASAWKVAPRDNFIGWSSEQRRQNLHLVVNNARFLILPWVTSRNLASRVLAGVAKRLPLDWQARYGYQPVLLETFVDKTRFHGTSYRAANWIHAGQTQGRGKLDSKHRHPLSVKHVFLFPLRKDFRSVLCSLPQPHSYRVH